MTGFHDHTRPTVVSLFDGIGGFPLAFSRAGATTVATVEIDRPAAGVTADRFPTAHHFDDVTEVTADDLIAAGFCAVCGILCAGWPCQDLSLAGRRLGLDGARSGLFFEIVRIAQRLRPRWLVLENVPGLLSAVCSCPGLNTCGDGCGDPHPVRGGACGPGRCMELHGGAMGAVLGALGELGYGFAYRVLDAQHFGVPQQRRRVVIVGCLGDGAAPAEILFEPEGVYRDPSSGRAAGQVVTALTKNGVGGGGGPDDNSAQGGHLIAAMTTAAPSVSSHHGRNSPGQDALVPVAFGRPDIAYALRRDPGGTGQGHNTNYVPMPAPDPIVFDWKTDGGDRAQPNVSTKRTSALRTEHADAVLSPLDAVRRLTPVECERLQGFPDGWTSTSNGRPQADAARYRQLGNSIAVPVFEWVARRLVGSCPTCASTTRDGDLSGRNAIDRGDGAEWCDDEWHDEPAAVSGG